MMQFSCNYYVVIVLIVRATKYKLLSLNSKPKKYALSDLTPDGIPKQNTNFKIKNYVNDKCNCSPREIKQNTESSF